MSLTWTRTSPSTKRNSAVETMRPPNFGNLDGNLREKDERSIVQIMLVWLIAALILGCFDKYLFKTGLTYQSEKAITQSSAEMLYSRIAGLLVLVGAVYLASNARLKKSALKPAMILWFPLVLYLWLELPIISGDLSVLLRTANFFVVIFSAALLASNKSIAVSFVRAIYYGTAVANTVGLTLFFLGNPFSYFTDGYGIMFTGLYPQKDLLSTTAALGALISIFKIQKRIRTTDLLILTVQITTLITASTLSSILALACGFLALFASRAMIFMTGLSALLLPLTHSTLGNLALYLGKDPTFTGRTFLWDYAMSHGMETPILGHGFKHVSTDLGWIEMLRSEFPNDSFFIPHSHNLWVEAFDKFGLLGLGILVGTLIIFPLISAKRYSPHTLHHLCLITMPFWLAKSALTMPFLNSSAPAYLWAFSLSYVAISSRSSNFGAMNDNI